MSRLLSLLALATLAAAASAQPAYDDPYYNSLDERSVVDDARPGVRVGFGVGPYVYSGPYYNATGAQLSDDARATNLAVTAEALVPLSGPLYGRVVGGLANIGADNDPNNDGIDDTAANPYYTSQVILAEADLLYYLVRPRAGGLSPYAFSGLSASFPTGDKAAGVPSAALAVPVGIGVEYGLTRNLSLYAEGAYRLGLTNIGPNRGFATALASVIVGPEVCDGTSPSYNRQACLEKGEAPFCDNGRSPDTACTEVSDNGGIIGGRNSFSGGRVLVGLRLGFGRAPAPPAVPAYVPPRVVVAPAAAPAAIAEPMVCDLVELNAVTFDYGAGTLDRRARSLLDENVDLLLSNPACCVFVDGYTDTSEGDRFGLNLGGRRAQSVYDYYLSRGVEASRLQIRNRGVAVPNCDKEDLGPGCERNRRVESLPVDCERFRFLIDNPSYDPY